MIVIPAIDLIAGRCVRLYKGDYQREKVYDTDPVARARFWHENGANLIHLVDLDGAREGFGANGEVIRSIRKGVDCLLEVGGGIRSAEDAQYYLEMGIDRVILGTMAARDPVPVEYLAGKYPGRIIVGADAIKGRVAIQGWQKTAARDVFSFAASFNHLNLAGILFTDVDTDGTLQGPNIAAQRRMGESIDNPLIASGGISRLDDISRLAGAGIPNLYGVVVGTALYEEVFTLPEALAAAEVSHAG